MINQAASVTDVAGRFGVTRQTVHRWLRRYAAAGLGGLVDGSARPLSCPHQMPPEVEARIVELRRVQPGWGPRTIRFGLEAERVVPLPGRSSIYRCLVRHGLIEPEARRRKKADYKRWERSRAMELWQMDIVGGVRLVDGWKASIVSGVDDHSRFVISARVVERATARPVCDALALAMRTHGVPQEILTDNGKVFTGRFGPGTGEVLFDRICRENGIKHILTAPRSPTTTGKVERWHKTLRREFLNGGCSSRSPMPRSSWTGGCTATTTSVAIKASVMSCRGNGSGSPTSEPSESRSSRCRSRPRHVGLGGPAGSASPPCRIRSGCGSTVRPSRCPSPTDLCRSITAACSSPPTLNVTGRPRSNRPWPAR